MLYTHGEETITDRNRLKEYAVPTLADLQAKKGDRAGGFWQPVQFHTMATTIAEVAESRGLRIEREHYNVSRDGHDLYACFNFAGTVPGRDDMSSTLGWRFSNMQRFALKGVSGARVFICNNGAIVGDFVFGHKMTNGHDRHVTVEHGMDRWQQQVNRIAHVYESMERCELKPEQVDHLLMAAMRERIIASNQLAKVDAEFAGDRSKTQFGERPTARRLYEALTEVGKGWSSPRVVERGLRGFPDLFLRTYGDQRLAAAMTEGDLGSPSVN